MTHSSGSTPMRIFDQLDPLVLHQRAELILEAASHMSPQCWAAERILANFKWFDYRFLSPVQATNLFVEEYILVYRQKWGENFDTVAASKKRATAAGGLFHSRKEFSEFWNARAHADLLGVTYRLYIWTAMETALRRAKQQRLLRAGQMRRADCVVAIEKRSEEELTGACWFSEFPHYRMENDHALPDQTAHQEHIARAARMRTNGSIAIGMAIDNARVLSVDKATAFYGAEFVATARERSAGLGAVAPIKALPVEQLIPSCFGLPAPLNSAAERCNRCPLVAQCQPVTDRLLEDVAARYGSTNPVLEHRRRSAKNRARRFRENKRLVAASANPDAIIEIEAA
ncbi:hypothetical protein FV232_16270 [Methylobacterium sp. WL30]|uniref:hypothetical protein n=1 Tax=unclassified Methylobacterium TaxID=2615210 RepID=UPI0011CBC51C|nr:MULTISPECIES: hypothetical protein [unclassified Methylobacterium]TXN40548.1 hypothetical protein FV225_05800 [Methylobacterium sp. WL93]TXN49643.1 hypothetical protein FV227_15550 [Methylobacterium sp. WL119]TXN66148.1 hypothetical protein FV232_16270 [Methylobacterium sp. WL30]